MFNYLGSGVTAQTSWGPKNYTSGLLSRYFLKNFQKDINEREKLHFLGVFG